MWPQFFSNFRGSGLYVYVEIDEGITVRSKINDATWVLTNIVSSVTSVDIVLLVIVLRKTY
jgi:hypothetical protein